MIFYCLEMEGGPRPFLPPFPLGTAQLLECFFNLLPFPLDTKILFIFTAKEKNLQLV
jgi:hypothetical protein